MDRLRQEQQQQQRRRFLAGAAPFSSETTISRLSNQSPVSPLAASIPNPYLQNLESAFSRLNVSHDVQPLYPGLYRNIFDGYLENFETFDDFAPSVHSGQAAFLPIQNNDLNTLGASRIQNFFRNPMMSGSSSDSRAGFVYGGLYQNPNFNDRRSTQRQSHDGLMNNGLVSENQNYGRRPLRSQEHVPWEDLRGKIATLAKDQFGCKFLQRIIGSATEEQIGMFLLEVIDYVGELIVDPFGNYVVQKLVEVLSEEQKTRILLKLTRNFQFISICLNVHGTRAVQKLLHYIKNQQQISMVVSAINQCAVALANDPNGHHVIQYCVQHFTTEDNKYILKQVAENCFAIATNKSGCCVLQRCVECCEGEPRDRIVAEIIANAVILAEDHYGNYVVQHILELRMPQMTQNLLTQFEGSYMALSCNKYGSNVVEKCLLTTREDQSMQIIVELLSNPQASMLLMDPFGNYVIQQALQVSKGQVQRAVLGLIQRNAQMMRSNVYGQKLLFWMNKNRKLLQQ